MLLLQAGLGLPCRLLLAACVVVVGIYKFIICMNYESILNAELMVVFLHLSSSPSTDPTAAGPPG